jgi:mannose-6-phosphate isomerase-like protein (cupin superfamily)
MIIADLSQIAGRRYPARRRTQNLVGGTSPIQCANFALGYVTLDPDGGQVPWHNQEQEEIYVILEGTGEMCLGEERRTITAGQAVFIPPRVFHQLTNLGFVPLKMIYCYGPAGDVAHWKQELADDLLLRPRRGRGALEAGAGRHAAPGRGRRPAAARGRAGAVHREAGSIAEPRTAPSPSQRVRGKRRRGTQ